MRNPLHSYVEKFWQGSVLVLVTYFIIVRTIRFYNHSPPMDFSHKPSRPNPYADANILSRVFFLWLTPLFREGRKCDLGLNHMFDTLDDDLSGELGNKLEKEWNKQKQKCINKGKSPSLIAALFAQQGLKCIIGSFGIAFGELVFRISQPIMLRSLIQSFSKDSKMSRRDQYFYAAGLSLTTLGLTLSYHTSAYFLSKVSMRCRLGLSSLIYRKILRLSTSGQNHTSVGAIVNLLSNDVNRFEQSLVFCVFLPLGVVQLLAYSYLLWNEFGIAAMAGVGVLLLLMPLQYLNGKLSANFRLQIAQRADERCRIMNEVITGIRILKMYAWEKPFAELIKKLRKQEVHAIRNRLYLRGFYLTLTHSAVKLLLFVTIITYVFEGNGLSADKVFFTSAVYHNLCQIWTYVVPAGISAIGETVISIRRIKKFLLLEEKKSAVKSIQVCANPHACPNVTMKSIFARWTKDLDTLKNLTVTLSEDSIVIIVGPCGSGKSSFLQVLLGELPFYSGTCDVLDTVSYAAQESWLFAGSIKQNILVGREYNKERYAKVIEAAALLEDFNQLPDRDATIVGDRGISLSGGQKARINLARCLYQDADIYLLDDPLSAVDTKISRHLFEKCIKKHLAGKLRILVTHQVQYLPQADHIILLKNGNILAQGSYDDLVTRDIDFVNLISDDDEGTTSRKPSLSCEEPLHKTNEDHSRKSSTVSVDSQISVEPNLKEEEKASGSVGFQIFIDYFKLGQSPCLFIITIIMFIICQASMTATDYWLSIWTNDEYAYNQNHNYKKQQNTSSEILSDSDNHQIKREFYIYVFSGLVCIVLLTNFLRAAAFFYYCMRIGINMHNKMFSSVIRAKIKFFDENPSGRIMNRFTKDLASTDELLPPTLFDMIIIFSQMLGVLTVIISSNYFLAPAALIVLLVLWIIRSFYVSTARDVKRIEGIAKSPIFTHASATFNGCSTIRALQVESTLIHQFDALQDIHTSSWFVFFSAMRCFGIWIELVSVIFVTIVSFSFLIMQDNISTDKVGLAISSAMTLSGWLQYGMRQSAEVETSMTSVERNLEYMHLPLEASSTTEDQKKPPKEWPDEGAISFHNMSLAYNENDVLKELTFDVKPREKIGIVGRTGAGKSSIIQAIFRLTEPRGDIRIDNVNINDMGLHDLRKNISIIPQEAMLFSGTMRYNLDPFNEYKDEELWNALANVQLKDVTPGLDNMLNDGGTNFSAGQRQLICLARAILRKNKIIVMDEATANVDPEQVEYQLCDRLRSIIDCDRILVLDNGCVKEYDHPHVLLQNPNSVFAAMVSRMGQSGRAMMMRVASEIYSGRRGSFRADTLSLLSHSESEMGDTNKSTN